MKREPASQLDADSLAVLYESGISDETIAVARIHPSPPGSIPDGTAGFAIPYRTIKGRENGFVRHRLTKGTTKYYQQPGSGNRLFIPPLPLLPHAIFTNPSTPLCITEGEKKALKAAQHGFPTVALAGVDNWRSRTFRLPANAVTHSADRQNVTFRINDRMEDMLRETVSEELLDIEWGGRLVYIIFDTDAAPNPDVERAAFEFGLWLDSVGAVPYRVYLPSEPNLKTGLDDFIVRCGPDALTALLEQQWAFPVPINPRSYINRRMRHPNRDDQLKVARTVLATLDGRGQRYRDPSDATYYYDRRDGTLYEWNSWRDDIRSTKFGVLIANEFGVTAADKVVMSRLADQFVSAPPIREVVPENVSTVRGDTFYWQLDDGHMARVDADDVSIVDNGTDDVLFRSDAVKPCALSSLHNHLQTLRIQGRAQPAWREIVDEMKLVPLFGMTLEQTRRWLTVQCYLAPYLQRWRGMMLPFEQCIAEGGSGKTSFYNLRKGVYSGRPSLDAVPNNRGDLEALLASTAFLVIDNIADVPRDLQAVLSDLLAQLVTDPDPHVSKRKLYSTNALARYPVYCTYAVTSIRSPFYRADLLERSIEFSLDKRASENPDDSWFSRHFHDRERFMADQMWAVRAFFEEVRRSWMPSYRTASRLENYSQAVVCMGVALGYERGDMHEIALLLNRHVRETINRRDYVLLAVRDFVAYKRRMKQADGDSIELYTWCNNQSGTVWADATVFKHAAHVTNHLLSHRSLIEAECDVKITEERGKVFISIDLVPNSA